MAISNIGPRSVTLQFKPGYDGKTSISRWQVEAQVSQVLILPSYHLVLCTDLWCSLLSLPQVGVIGENEDWVMVHQVSNKPEARSLEVPGLNPYTYYR